MTASRSQPRSCERLVWRLEHAVREALHSIDYQLLKDGWLEAGRARLAPRGGPGGGDETLSERHQSIITNWAEYRSRIHVALRKMPLVLKHLGL